MKKTGKHIVIVDYGVGNLWSIHKAARLFAPEAIISEEKEHIQHADALILPGVGTFKAGMDGLAVRGLTGAIKDFAAGGRPLLGICLGAQLLLSVGHEFGERDGLGIIEGEVECFPKLPSEYKVPNMGWHPITFAPEARADPLLHSIPDNSSMYFVHSYLLQPKRSEHILATSVYGGHTFCAVMKKSAVYGTQFHPEKSGERGIQVIKNFIEQV